MRNQAYIAIIALVAYIAAVLTLSTKCLDRQHQTSTTATTLDRFQSISANCTTASISKRLYDENYLEDNFNVRFLEEMQNLLKGNLTKYVMQIKLIQSQKMNDEFEIKAQEMKIEYESKISSIETANQQRILEMKKMYDDDDNNNVLFPADRVGNFASNMARVSRESFNTTFFSTQFGFEFMESYTGVKDLLLLYGSDDTIPSNFSSYTNRGNGKNKIPFIDDAIVATENCGEMRVVFISQHRQVKQCIAIVPNLDSFHVYPLVQPTMFEDPSKRNNLIVNHTQAFQFKSRYHRVQLPHDVLIQPPRFQEETTVFFKYLRNYLNVVDAVLQELRTILSKIAMENQVIIMMCNYGQAVLLNNFICNAQSRNINLSNLIVFTTDQETTDLVTSFGLTAFYDQGRFGEHPKGAARFGDAIFRDMAMGKIRAAQLVSVLGYDFLFQDVDVVWYKSPLKYFQNHKDDTFDMYFQKDGVVSKYNTPFGVNTGLYYVRNNELTQYFFTSLLLNGDTMFRSHNDQEDIGVRLADFSSTYGLKVKVIPRTETTTPGGYQFHDVSPFGKEYMKSILNKTHEPYVFHMSWTDGKKHKIQYFQQMGQWHVNDECIDKTLDEIVAGASRAKQSIPVHCCSLEPIVRCHYRDKPSIIPCSEYPPIEKEAPSWW